MRRRFVMMFIRQWLTVGVITAVCIVVMFIWLASKMTELDLKRSFSRPAMETLLDSYSVREDGTVHLSPKLLKQIEINGGWLQLLNEKGEVTYSYLTPSDVPQKYTPGELVNYIRRLQPFPYRLYILIRPISGEMVTLLYGIKDPLDMAARQLAEEGSSSEQALKEAEHGTESIAWPDEVNYVLQEHGVGIQLLDQAGKELHSYRLPSGLPDVYPPQELVLRLEYPERYGVRLEMSTEEETGRMWLIHAPYDAAPGIQLTAIGPTVYNEVQLLLYGFGSVAVILLLACGGLSLWQGNRFGTPMLHVMQWLQNLAHQHYKEPVGRRGRPRSKRRAGRLKWRYRPYAEVMYTVQELSQQLEHHELEREQNDRMREEWIASLSHDLKTPLSSIYGYAQLLRSSQYEWGRDEIAEFASTMAEKAEYMDELIQDLNLLYRLKNASDVLQLERHHMNMFLKEAVTRIAEDPQWLSYEIQWSPASDPIFYNIDPKAFRRMMDNIIINALMHNPEGTRLKVSLQKGSESEFSVHFEDNGLGMDEKTQANLFQRYYRGTDTESSSSGSGLGMAIAKEIAEGHGGKVEVRSEAGKGTVIIVMFSYAENV
ncbi:sensor histidine kinase [Paenibacillus fonticola]|uniref:sensor histidine kinase n=1 Tax=Paenibacillus fonticola TaxID=379896 RepID=UPI001F0B0CEC|nr:HAMP domain-containing sensor histidine kinase [Paenibacillus fonticola]